MNNSFTNNSAENHGGAVYWNYFLPTNIVNQTYTSNTAGVYGNDLAWYAQVLKSITQEDYEQIYGGSSRR